MPWVYILECADSSYYVGSTVDLERRLHQHQLGLGADHTKPARRRPVRLAWSGEFEHVGAAFGFEKQLQGWGRAKREALIRGEYDALPDLASRPSTRRPPDGDAGGRGVSPPGG